MTALPDPVALRAKLDEFDVGLQDLKRRIEVCQTTHGRFLHAHALLVQQLDRLAGRCAMTYRTCRPLLEAVEEAKDEDLIGVVQQHAATASAAYGHLSAALALQEQVGATLEGSVRAMQNATALVAIRLPPGG